MKLGLIRHFKVDMEPSKEGMNTSDYLRWIDEYDRGDIIQKPVDLLNIDWNRCYSSDMKRAYETAEAIFDGDIIKTHLLREVKLHPPVDTREKKDYQYWKDICNEAWREEKPNQLETRSDTLKRVNTFLDFIEHKNFGGDRILIVSHVITMRVFEDELIERGFDGGYNEDPDYGKIYLFEK